MLHVDLKQNSVGDYYYFKIYIFTYHYNDIIMILYTNYTLFGCLQFCRYSKHYGRVYKIRFNRKPVGMRCHCHSGSLPGAAPVP